MRGRRSSVAWLFGACTLALVSGSLVVMAQTPAPPQGAAGAGAGRGGGRGGVAPGVFTVVDLNKDGTLTQGELMMALEKIYSDADADKAGTITQEQLLTALNAALPAPPPPQAGRAAGPACGGQSSNPHTPCPDHVTAMMAALPDKAPAKPARPRKVLVLDSSLGFRHSSIPLAAATVEAIGKKTGAWSTVITWDAADINTANLAQYDALFLASNTGCFLDKAGDRAETDARRAALLAFVRGGKGIAGIHAATDSYHSTCPNDQPAAPAGARGGGRGGGGQGAQLSTQMMTQADKNTDQKLNIVELGALATTWFAKLDTGGTGRVSQADFVARFNDALPAPAARGGRAGDPTAPPVGRGMGQQERPTWPEFNTLIGGIFKYHWNDGTHVPAKIDDPTSPLTKMFMSKTVEAAITPDGVFPKAVAGKGYTIVDETYTFAQNSFSRTNVRVLTSVDYDAMPAATKAMEPAATARTDGDYALSYIRREGKGRVFYETSGHNERVYAVKPMLEHLLAGIQYAIGDLKADDRPSAKPPTVK